MGLFDSGMVNFIKLLIIIGLISMLYMIVMQKIKEQNHKITSLLSVVSSMAIEITNLKTPSEPVYEKIDISNESDSESDSDSDSDDDTNGVIDFFEITKTDMLDVNEMVDLIEPELVEPGEVVEPVEQAEHVEQVEHVESEVDYKKLSVSKLLDIAVEKNLTSKEKGGKLKKKDLIDLLS